MRKFTQEGDWELGPDFEVAEDEWSKDTGVDVSMFHITAPQKRKLLLTEEEDTQLMGGKKSKSAK